MSHLRLYSFGKCPHPWHQSFQKHKLSLRSRLSTSCRVISKGEKHKGCELLHLFSSLTVKDTEPHFYCNKHEKINPIVFLATFVKTIIAVRLDEVDLEFNSNFMPQEYRKNNYIIYNQHCIMPQTFCVLSANKQTEVHPLVPTDQTGDIISHLLLTNPPTGFRRKPLLMKRYHASSVSVSGICIKHYCMWVILMTGLCDQVWAQQEAVDTALARVHLSFIRESKHLQIYHHCQCYQSNLIKVLHSALGWNLWTQTHVSSGLLWLVCVLPRSMQMHSDINTSPLQ